MNPTINSNSYDIIVKSYAKNLKVEKFGVRNLTINNDSKKVSFENNLQYFGKIQVTWQDGNNDNIVDNNEINITLEGKKIAAKDITTGQVSAVVLKEIGNIITGLLKKKLLKVDAKEPTLANEVKPAKSVKEAKLFDSTSTEVRPTSINESVKPNNLSSSLEFLKTQSDSSAQLLGLGGCVIHATANSIVHDLKAGTASESLKTALQKVVQYDEKTGDFTFTPSQPPTVPITITKQEIQNAKEEYNNTSSNNQFAVALELAWRKYQNQGSNFNEGNAPEGVFKKFFGLSPQTHTGTLSSALDDLKNNAGKSALLGVYANKGKPYGHEVAVRFDAKKDMYVVTNSSLLAGIDNTSKDTQDVIYFSKDEILNIAYDLTIV